MYIFATDGIINDVIVNIFGGTEKTFLSDPTWFRPIYIITEIWQNAGWGSIIYLAALSGVDQQLYEAAAIDGASRLKQVIHISLPGISSIISLILICCANKAADKIGATSLW